MTYLRQVNGILVITLVLFAGALVGCNPEREGELCDGTACVTVARPILGDYDGSVQDTLAGVGRAHVTLSNRIDHPGTGNENEGFSDISGNWQVTFSNPAENSHGFLGGILSGLTLTGTVIADDPTRCSFTITALLVEGEQLEGAYTSINCSPVRTGTFDISK